MSTFHKWALVAGALGVNALLWTAAVIMLTTGNEATPGRVAAFFDVGAVLNWLGFYLHFSYVKVGPK